MPMCCSSRPDFVACGRTTLYFAWQPIPANVFVGARAGVVLKNNVLSMHEPAPVAALPAQVGRLVEHETVELITVEKRDADAAGRRPRIDVPTNAPLGVRSCSRTGCS